MRQEDFDFLTKLIKDRSGLVLSADKMYLLESRLMPLARKSSFATLDDLVLALRGKNEVLARNVVDAMTTNESFFFRDIKPFDQFRDLILPMVLKEHSDRKTLRIWSAACSSGQEIFSLAMLIKEQGARFAGWKIELVGTDLSREILAKAKMGVYSQFEVQRGLPVAMLVKYFTKDGELWHIKDEIKSMVDFREWNLLDSFSALGMFDVVFCRNVLIYFDQATKKSILDRMSGQIAADGFLCLGGAETVLGVSEKFKPITGYRGMYSQTVAGNVAAKIPPPQAPAAPPAPAFAPGIKPVAPIAPSTLRPAAATPAPAFSAKK
ncbi:chemotaxis protein CheR [Alphaproteobacteria bacterium]|nr:chemotaxis protein CheR [Alphaproteobacteria bacterium]